MKKLLVAALFVAGVGVGLNAENLSDEQVKLLRVNCMKNGDKNSCQRLIDSKILPSVKQCNKKTCNNTGFIYEMIRDYQQAFEFYKKACDLSDNLGCAGLADFYYQGLGVTQNFFEALKFNKKACDLNSETACYNLGVAYYEGKGTMQDIANAKKYFEKACNTNHAMACNNLGFLYDNGQGVRQNRTTAKEYYGKACDLGSQVGCDNYRILNKMGVK